MDSLMGLLQIHHIGRLFFALMLDRRVSWWLKLSAWSGIIYIFSALDVIPDFFTGIGLLDDFILALLIGQAFLEAVPAKLVDEHCERLGIDPQRVFVDIPRTVSQARDLFEWIAEGSARRRAAQPAWPAPDETENVAQPSGTAPASARRATRYSAFKEERD